MSVPKDLKYTEEHEWIRFEGDRAVVGITDYAQEALGEIVYVELPVEGGELFQGDSFGGAESTKAVSELFAPSLWGDRRGKRSSGGFPGTCKRRPLR